MTSAEMARVKADDYTLRAIAIYRELTHVPGDSTGYLTPEEAGLILDGMRSDDVSIAAILRLCYTFPGRGQAHAVEFDLAINLPPFRVGHGHVDTTDVLELIREAMIGLGPDSTSDDCSLLPGWTRDEIASIAPPPADMDDDGGQA